MKYERQTQAALDKFDQSLARLRDLIKRGEQQNAIRFMEEGELKERFEDLQSIIKLSYTNPLGASGTVNTRTL